MSISSVAVFCGSKNGKDPLYARHARELGHLLAQKNITAIYGGATGGIMGVLAEAILEKKGRITGIIPKVLTAREIQHKGLTELYEVEDMHVRKAMLYEKCDAAIILAGGYGTMDEFFEMLTWNQLNIHDKEIFILNTSGFYDHLILQIKKMAEDNFLYEDPFKKITVISSPVQLSF